MHHEHHPTPAAAARLEAVDALDTTTAPTDLAAYRQRNRARLVARAYAAYLSFDDVDPDHPDRGAGFRSAYLASFPNQTSLLAATRGGFGWHDQNSSRLAAARYQRDVDPADEPAVWRFLHDYYRLISTESEIHVFDPDR